MKNYIILFVFVKIILYITFLTKTFMYKFYIIYKTTNLFNNRYYIGCHKTNDLNDNYLGSGILLNTDISSIGSKHFKKEILHIFDNENDMFNKEAEIVNFDFIQKYENYNLSLGGKLSNMYFNNNVKVINKDNKIFFCENNHDLLKNNNVIKIKNKVKDKTKIEEPKNNNFIEVLKNKVSNILLTKKDLEKIDIDINRIINNLPPIID